MCTLGFIFSSREPLSSPGRLRSRMSLPWLSKQPTSAYNYGGFVLVWHASLQLKINHTETGNNEAPVEKAPATAKLVLSCLQNYCKVYEVFLATTKSTKFSRSSEARSRCFCGLSLICIFSLSNQMTEQERRGLEERYSRMQRATEKSFCESEGF